MPAAFTKCVKNGGKVRTKDLGDGKYMHICYDKNGKSHPGEVLKKKSPKKSESKKQEPKPKKQKKESGKLVEAARATLADLEKLKEHFENYLPNRE